MAAQKILVERAQCFLCGAPELARLGVDRRGSPYYRCAGCGSTLFLRSERVFNFVAYLLRNGVSLSAICAGAKEKVGVAHE